MTQSSPLISLAERCEKEAAGSRELDAEIAIATGLIPPGALRMHLGPEYARFATGPYSHWDAPLFSTSLDAARKLGGMVVFASDIGADGLPMVKLVFDTTTSPIIEHTGIAATLELAWCAAALRALAATE